MSSNSITDFRHNINNNNNPEFNSNDSYIQEELYRFTQDLEFLQILSNPNYLEWLAGNGYFKEEAFLNYLSYLLYFKNPEYAKFITKGLEIPSFMANLKSLIEKDWIESAEIEKQTKNFYDSIVASRDDFYLNGASNNQEKNESFNNDLNLNSNLMGLNRRSSI